MRIAILGATGAVGRHVTALATTRGHETVACSRATGVDLVSGRGLADALAGCDVALDVTNVTSTRRRTATDFFAATATTLQRAAREAGVPQLVALSIVGIERLRSVGYYAAKLAQELRLLDGAVPATVVRATQFHELAALLAARGSFGPVCVLPQLRVQPVAARSVAAVLVDVATSSPGRGRSPDVGGPGPVATLPGLARAVLAARGERRRVVPLPLPPPLHRAVADGALLPGADALLVGPTFSEWLEGPDGPGPG